MINFDEYKHEWKFDLPWHMVNLKDWFYMVNVGHFGDVFLHVRILGIRSLWTFPEPESRRTKYAPDEWESARKIVTMLTANASRWTDFLPTER